MHMIAADDEKLALESLTDAIRAVCPEASVHGFDKCQDVLDFAEKNSCDIAFLDIEMRDGHGVELALKLKAIHPGLNIVFVTGYSDYMREAFQMHASGYLLKPVKKEMILCEIENLRHPAAVSPSLGLYVQTFGNFQAFMDGKPLDFKKAKAKELFALLIDRRGAGISTARIAVTLWENQEYSRSLKNQVQNAIAQVRQTLEEAGAGDVLIKSWNNLSVDVTKIDCDYYKLLNGDIAGINSFTGEYMTEYSWAEFTNGFLTNKTQR